MLSIWTALTFRWLVKSQQISYLMMPLITFTDGSSDGCFPALLIGVGPVSCTNPTLTPRIQLYQHSYYASCSALKQEFFHYSNIEGL